MSSTITKVMAVRVKNETAEYFRDKPLNRIVESVHGLAEKREIEIKGDGVVVVSGSNDKREGDSVCSG